MFHVRYLNIFTSKISYFAIRTAVISPPDSSMIVVLFKSSKAFFLPIRFTDLAKKIKAQLDEHL